MIGKKIKERREQLGLSQEQLAKLIGVSKSAVSNYEINISSPKETVLFKLFDALKCDANYLYEDYIVYNDDFIVTNNEKSHIKKYRKLDTHGKKIVDFTLNEEYERCTYIEDEQEEPTITISHSTYKVSAGTGFELGEGDSWETIEVPDTTETRKADFAITIKGNSMEPVYYDGDIVLVKAQDAVDVGEVGIFTVNGAGYIKRYGGDRLISLNAEYEDILFNDNDEIYCKGKVIGRI